MPASAKGAGASPASPAQPTQAPSRCRITESIAVTSPPGERCHSFLPSGPTTRSTGRRLAAMTRSNLRVATAVLLTVGGDQPMYRARATAGIGGPVASIHEDLGRAAEQGHR